MQATEHARRQARRLTQSPLAQLRLWLAGVECQWIGDCEARRQLRRQMRRQQRAHSESVAVEAPERPWRRLRMTCVSMGVCGSGQRGTHPPMLSVSGRKSSEHSAAQR